MNMFKSEIEKIKKIELIVCGAVCVFQDYDMIHDVKRACVLL